MNELADRPLVMIVDDDITVRMLVGASLERAGFRVHECESGAHALDAFPSVRPAVILLDVVMPDLDGYQVCRAIRTAPGGEHVPIVMLTGLDDVISIEKAFVVGATDFVTKPINYPILTHRVRYVHRACVAYEDLRQTVKDQRRAELEVARMAYYDQLTGLPNREYLERFIRNLLGDDPEGRNRFALVVIELDHFKRVNDTLGHTVGDRLLREIAYRLDTRVRGSQALQGRVDGSGSSSLGSVGLVARLGGDEFGIVLQNLQTDSAARELVGHVKRVIAEPMVLDLGEVVMTASLGVAIHPEAGSNFEGLLRSADAAMYQVKHAGRNGCRIWDPTIDQSARDLLVLESELRGAIERNELDVYYQPKIDAQSGCIIGMEALVRWNHPTRGLVQPLEFIPLAEQSGLIISLGDWVLRTACKQTKTWADRGLAGLSVSVNVSARQLADPNFLRIVEQAILHSGLQPAELELELTEGSLIENRHPIRTTLKAIHDIGISLALDDFGTGYSSLSYLKRFPIDTLKIDRAFVRDLTTDEDSAAIVAAIVAMSKSLRLNVVAEGVETASQLEVLRTLGCAQVQGYLYSPPLRPDEFEQWVQHWRTHPPSV